MMTGIVSNQPAKDPMIIYQTRTEVSLLDEEYTRVFLSLLDEEYNPKT